MSRRRKVEKSGVPAFNNGLLVLCLLVLWLRESKMSNNVDVVK